jgi:hypothetical protein
MVAAYGICIEISSAMFEISRINDSLPERPQGKRPLRSVALRPLRKSRPPWTSIPVRFWPAGAPTLPETRTVYPVDATFDKRTLLTTSQIHGFQFGIEVRITVSNRDHP